MGIISDDSHWAETMAVCIVRLIFSSDSRTGRLHLLLTASKSCHCIARMYFIQFWSGLVRNEVKEGPWKLLVGSGRNVLLSPPNESFLVGKLASWRASRLSGSWLGEKGSGKEG